MILLLLQLTPAGNAPHILSGLSSALKKIYFLFVKISSFGFWKCKVRQPRQDLLGAEEERRLSVTKISRMTTGYSKPVWLKWLCGWNIATSAVWWLFLFQQVSNNVVIRLLEKTHTTTLFCWPVPTNFATIQLKKKSQKESSMKISHTEINCRIKNKLVYNFVWGSLAHFFPHLTLCSGWEKCNLAGNISL